MTEAILTFLREPEDDPFTALVLGFNKLVLVRAGEEVLYRRLLDDPAVRTPTFRRRRTSSRRSRWRAARCTSFYLPTYRRRAASFSGLYRWYFQRDDQVPPWMAEVVRGLVEL